MTPFRHGKKEAGFTLVELVLIIVILGILAVFAVPRMVDTTATKAAAAARKLQSDIAYAQELAMTRNVRYRVYVNAAPAPAAGYAVTDSAGNPAPDPAGGNLSVTLNSGSYAGITISPAGSPDRSSSSTRWAFLTTAEERPLGAASTLTVNANAAPGADRDNPASDGKGELAMKQAKSRSNGQKLRRLAQRYGVSLLVLFGSEAKGARREDSDVDLAVWIEKKLSPGREIALMAEMSGLFPGRTTDIAILNESSPLLRFEVSKAGVPLYEKSVRAPFSGFN